MFQKSCPRCNLGDLLFNSHDQLICLQCGYELRPLDKVRLLMRHEQDRPKVPTKSTG